MKKSLILVGLLSIGYAHAQEGNVGINTDAPKATLEIKPTATNLTGTTNEGIVAPKLSKTRVAAIAAPVEGTLVYVTNEAESLITAYTGTDSKVAKIDEKGYYYFDGTEWVKTGNIPQIWQKQANTDVKLIDTDVNADVRYTASGYKVQPVVEGTGVATFTIKNTGNNADKIHHRDQFAGYNNSLIFSSMVKGGESEASHRIFNNQINVVDANEQGMNLKMASNRFLFYTDANMIKPQERLWGSQFSVVHNSPVLVKEITNLPIFTTLAKDASANYFRGVYNQMQNYSANNLGTFQGFLNEIYSIGSGNITNLSAFENITRLNGIAGGAPTITNVYGFWNQFVSYNVNNQKVTNMYGIKLESTSGLDKNKIEITNNYGVYIGDVIGAKTPTGNTDADAPNYAIYTNAGKVRFGDLQAGSVTDKVVVVDASGVLKTVERGSIGGGNVAPAETITATNGLTKTTRGEVKLGGSLAEATTIEQGDKNLTISNTGTGVFEVQGTSKHNGAHYVKVTKVTEASYTAKADDYFITVDGHTSEVIIKIPNASDAVGRVFIISNKTSSTVAIQDATGTQAIMGSQSPGIAKNFAMTIASDGTKWYGLINY